MRESIVDGVNVVAVVAARKTRAPTSAPVTISDHKDKSLESNASVAVNKLYMDCTNVVV